MYLYYKYAIGGSKLVLLSYVNEFLYWYTSEELGKCFLGTLLKRFHLNFLGYEHWFMSVRISKINDRSISVDQARYATYFVSKYIDTSTII